MYLLLDYAVVKEIRRYGRHRYLRRNSDIYGGSKDLWVVGNYFNPFF